ncbi:MAG: hypothetical protein ABJL99_23170 [Aliishimia sp.]
MQDANLLTDNAVSDQTRAQIITREIRIQQSVEIQSTVPSQVTGNWVTAAVFVFFFPAITVSSGAIFALVPIFLLSSLAARSYISLRNRPRPQKVSRRRIRFIGINSFMIGLSWAAFSFLAVRHGDATASFLVVMGTTAFAFSCLVSVSSLPKASLLAPSRS